MTPFQKRPHYEPLNSDPDYGERELPYVSGCRSCGAVVSDESRHTEWHAALAQLVSGYLPDGPKDTPQEAQ